MGKRVIKAILIIISIVLIGIGSFIIYEVLSPEIEYKINPPKEDEIIEKIESEEDHSINRLIIPSIGVDMKIGQDNEFLDYGGWIQRLDSDNLPNLIAIHRFGWSTLSAEQKMKQTLYHVNKLNEGDIVFVIWNGKKFEYRIKEITDGTNNPSDEYLTIYTCKFYSSNQRVFVLLG
ncbi:sortase [Candidatus Dojkabacteria bacterium]|uniref:Sortase n=1 Tax=Candidatus Dojkabacteria bacterium TaxID=2099670 RepID=A0A955I4F9_9BACT|nr:sortase [Candidatus Dojkabacteria bacterium]